jgi:SAM-dependent methyltransferase
VPFEEQVATSFGRVAGSYDRVRPGPAPAAVDWLVPTGCGVAVDLAAGTGLFTRALQQRAVEVVAVEPDGRMREVLASHSPNVQVLAGQAEAMPLPDGYADAVFVSTAWHWFDPERAVHEIARVLKDGGRLGVLWTGRDRQQPWVAELDLIRDASADESHTVATVQERLARRHQVTLPPDAEFGPAQTASFGFTRTMTVDDTLDWLATSSEFIRAGDATRAAALGRLRTALTARPQANEAAGEERGNEGNEGNEGKKLIQMPLRSWCWRADRLRREAR